jgi:hypothetical protein
MDVLSIALKKLTGPARVIPHQPVELLKPDHVGGLLTDQQSKRQLASFPLVQQQLSKFIFLDPRKSFVNHGQHLEAVKMRFFPMNDGPSLRDS